MVIITAGAILKIDGNEVKSIIGGTGPDVIVLTKVLLLP
jgi:hypothetical protein